VFEDFRPLTGHHIACSGGQRVWNLPADVAAQVEALTK
jgi:hypothetical protein